MANWINRPQLSTSWNIGKIGGSYLINNVGQYILTRAGERIIVKVPGGNINLQKWINRIIP